MMTNKKQGVWSEQALRVLKERYLLKDGSRVIEDPDEMCWRVAQYIAGAEERYSTTGRSWLRTAEDFYAIMVEQKFLPNSPTLMNAGTGNGEQFSACFVLPVEDSIPGIFDAVKWQAIIHKSGGGCIAGDARVWTTFCGLEPIEVLFHRATADSRSGVTHGSGVAYDVSDLNIETVSMNPQTGGAGLRKVTHVWEFAVPAEDQVTVRTREGTMVQTSSWHPFMALRGRSLVEVPAEELVAGDVILGPERPDHFWPWSDHRNVGSLPIDPRMGWLLGFTLGDGSFGYVPALRQYRVRWFSGTHDVLERVQDVLATQGIEVGIQRDNRSESTFLLATLNQRFVLDLLEACGLGAIGVKEDHIRIPETIGKSPLSVVRAFLAGLMDSDGYVAEDGSPSYSTVSAEFAEDLSALLGLLGYRPTVSRKLPHGHGKQVVFTVQFCPLPQVPQLARDLAPYLANALRLGRLASRSTKETALRLPFRVWRVRLAELGLVKARGDTIGGPGPCAEELGRWSCNAQRRCRRDDLRAVAAQVKPRDRELGELMERVAAYGQEVASIERAVTPKPYYDLSVEGWNTYAAGQYGMAMIHNTGFAFSRLRPSGSSVKSTQGVASGPVSFMKIFDCATEQVKQGGKRRGANMGILRCDHPDVLEFIDCKLQGGINNFNISVAITDAFMDALARDGEYDLVDPQSKQKVGSLRAREVMDRIVQAAWRTGDPGLVFIERINAGTANPVPSAGPIEATNPCVTGDTLIYTDRGLQRAAELAEEGTRVLAVVDGQPQVVTSSPVVRAGRKPVFRLETLEGYTLRLTGDHQVMTRRGWVRACDLQPSDEIRLLSHTGGFGKGGSLALGRLLGWLVGDGTLTADRAVFSFFGDEKRELAPLFADMMQSVVPVGVGRRQHYATDVEEVSGRDEARVRSTRFWRIASEHGLHPGDKHRVPESIFTGSREMQQGFLQALFTADVHVSGTLEKGVSVRLTSISASLLQDVQRLLLNFGIASTIYSERRAGGLRPLPDGHGGRAEYMTSAYHDLVIAKDNLLRFASDIGFLSEAKQSGLVNRLAAYRRGPYRETFYARFSALIPDGEEDVYDLTEPLTHSFVANGVVVHNCGEQPLYAFDACNLGSINLAKFVKDGPYASNPGRDAIDWDDLERTTRLATRFLDDVIEVNPFPLTQIDEVVQANRRIGLGIMGWADMLLLLGIPYDSEEALTLAHEVMGFINRVGHEESARVAEERGPFPNWSQSIYQDGPPLRNSTVTTIAPTGTISIIAGASSGVEPLFAIAYRHIVGERNLAFVNPIFEQVAKGRGFASDEITQQVARSGSVHGVPGVPADVQRVFVTAHEIAPEWHVRMQAAFQAHTDNGVSKCIAAGTLIPTSRGLIRIEDFALTEQEDSFTLLDYDIEVDGHKVLSHYRAGMKPATKITLDNGASLTGATESHRVLTIEGWKRLADIRVGDLVIGKFIESHGPGGVPLPWDSTYRTNANAVPIPSRMTPSFAELLGMLIADGHTVESTGQVGLTSKDDSVARQFFRLAEEIFGVCPKVIEDQRNGVRVAYITSRNLVRFIERLIGKGAYNKLLPDAILQGSAEEKLAFLRGISLDGYLTDRGLCVYGGMSEQCAYHVAEICRSFGLPKVYQGVKDVPGRGTCHYVTMSDALQALIRRVEERKNVEPIAVAYKVHVGSGVVAATHGPVDHPAYSAFRALRQQGRTYCKNTTAAKLAWPTATPVYRVVNVEDAGLVDMYDIEVAESHAYVVNGMVSHNTINLPFEATVKDVEDAYMLAWKEGCLGITVFRNGSKGGEAVLHVGAEDRTTEDGTVPLHATTPAAQAAPAAASAAPPAAKPLTPAPRPVAAESAPGARDAEPTHMKPRLRRMEGTTYRAETPLGTAFITVNRNGNQEPFEVFLNVGKAGSDTAAVAEALGRLISLTLRLPSPLSPTERVREIVAQLTGIGGGRSMGFGKARVRSLPDAIAHVLSEDIGMAPLGAPVDMDEAVNEVQQPILPGFEQHIGDLCPECGHATLIFEEGCQKCYSCGFSEC